MDYMYGNLQHQVEKVEYTGKESSTAVVLVHPRENTILVDVKPLSPSILKPQIDFNKDGEYVLIGIVENTNVKYKWITKEEMSDFLQEQINDLQLQIHQLDVNESQYREQIALDITRIEKEIEIIDNEMSTFETEQHMFNNTVTVYMDTNDENIKKLFVGLSEEIESRKSADDILQENIDEEASTRESADTQLSNRIVTATNVLQSEINSLQEEDTTINNTISEMIERDACTIKVVNSDDYKIGVFLYNYEGKKISSSSIDLPLESVIVDGRYDAEKKEIILTLENGDEIDIPVEDLIAGLANETEIDELHDELNSFEANQGVFNEKVSVFITNTTKAVNSIQEELDEEEKIREEADNTLQNNIDTETNQRKSADTQLLNTINTSVTSLNEEDASLQEQITSLKDELKEEEETRENTDDELQSNIDTITSSLNKEIEERTSESAYTFDMELDHTTYVLTFNLLNKNRGQLATAQVDFPEEILIMDMTYDKDLKEIVITLRNGEKRYIPLGDLIDGLVTTTTFDNAVASFTSSISSLQSQIDTWNQSLQTEITNRTTADTSLSGLIAAETTARETEYTGLATTIQNIQTGVNESIASIQEVVNNSLSIASDASSTANQAAKTANEAAESANQAAEEATEAAEAANAVVDRVDELDKNKTSIKIKEEVIDEDTQETETIYTSIPNLYFDGVITRNEEEEIEEVTIILDCGGAE